MKPDKILPFRFIAALRYGPAYAAELESAMLRNLAEIEPFTGMTVVLVDGSGSMQAPVSAKSEMTRHDAALGVAIAARELSESCRVFAYSTNHVELPAFRGLALGEAIRHAVPADETYMGQAVSWINQRGLQADHRHHRRTVHDTVPGPKGVGFVINAAMQTGVGYGPWHHIDGWSDQHSIRARCRVGPCLITSSGISTGGWQGSSNERRKGRSLRWVLIELIRRYVVDGLGRRGTWSA